MTITEIKKIGRGDRYSLYINGQFIAAIEAEILAKAKLKTGDEISEDDLEKLQLENGDYASFDRALSYLEKGMKTEKGIRDYLKTKGYLPESIQKTVEKLNEYGYIDDGAFAESYIRTYGEIKGKQKIKYDLLSKGVDSEIIEEKLAELITEQGQFETCLKLAKKYLKNKTVDQKTKQKLYAHLASKGFSFDTIAKATKEAFEEQEF